MNSLKTFSCLLLLLTLAASSGQAEIVRPAPLFSWSGLNGAQVTLARAAGQPVILLIAPSARSGAFKKQLKQIETLYRQYAGRGTLFCAAFTVTESQIRTNIPFLYASDVPAVAAAYGSVKGHFRIAVIAEDRNLDLVSSEVLSAEKLRDVIDNSFVQQSVRREKQ